MFHADMRWSKSWFPRRTKSLNSLFLEMNCRCIWIPYVWDPIERSSVSSCTLRSSPYRPGCWRSMQTHCKNTGPCQSPVKKMWKWVNLYRNFCLPLQRFYPIYSPSPIMSATLPFSLSTWVRMICSLKVFGWTLVRDITPLLSRSVYIDPSSRLPLPSREPMWCEVWGASPVKRTTKKQWMNLQKSLKANPRLLADVKVPGREVCSQVTPSRPPGGKWVTLVTWQASSVGSAVIWGFRAGSRVSV